MADGRPSIILPNRELVSEAKILFVPIGGAQLDYVNNPQLGRAIRTGGHTGAIDQLIMVCLNRTDALVREIIELRQRLSALDGVAVPEAPTPLDGTEIVGAPEASDPFAAAIAEAAKKASPDHVNGTPRGPAVTDGSNEPGSGDEV